MARLSSVDQHVAAALCLHAPGLFPRQLALRRSLRASTQRYTIHQQYIFHRHKCSCLCAASRTTSPLSLFRRCFRLQIALTATLAPTTPPAQSLWCTHFSMHCMCYFVRRWTVGACWACQQRSRSTSARCSRRAPTYAAGARRASHAVGS